MKAEITSSKRTCIIEHYKAKVVINKKNLIIDVNVEDNEFESFVENPKTNEWNYLTSEEKSEIRRLLHEFYG